MPDVPQPAAVASSEEDFFAFDLQPVTTADAPMSVETEPETKHNDAQNSSDSENEERIETESENEEKETGIENEEIGSEDKETESEDKETGIENEETGIENEETRIENEETGIENEETGIENEETGTEDKEMEGEDMEIEREEMENEAVTSESTREKAPSEFVFLLQLPNPTDPSHVQKNNIKYNEAFVKCSNSIGPCRPLVQFPKNQDGRSFQGHWYDENPWLEYSPQYDAMYCFSCRILMNDDKYKCRSTWKNDGALLQ
ncbi:hypothetical protein NQZ68_016848 [Dissostichus eleginoides]|nr:hypothetical protein NQZ68_016848 [Dissostichus eleginoides]